MRTIQRIFVTAIVLGLTGTCIYCSSDEEVFRESVVAGKAAERRVQWYIFSEIAQAQAEHGYYVRAIETARLVDRYPDQLFIKLVSIRAKKGDIAGAKSMATGATPQLRLRADEAIATIQAATGDFDGARETGRDLADKSTVLEAIGTRQIESGDLEGALKTATEMKAGASDGVLFGIAEELEKRGNHQRAHEIAQRISDPDMARNAEGASATPPARPVDACALASSDAKAGRFAEAHKRLESANCDCRTVAYIREEARDAAGAEGAMRKCPNRADVSAGMAELAKRSAARGDIKEALKFADLVHVTGEQFEEGYLAPALRDIGRSWGKSDLNNALAWARSKPDGYQRAMALLGVAESISASGLE